MECVSRLAMMRYGRVRDSVASMIDEFIALDLFTDDGTSRVMSVDADDFRRIELYNERTDFEFRRRAPMLKKLYRLYAAQESMVGSRSSMSFNEYNGECGVAADCCCLVTKRTFLPARASRALHRLLLDICGACSVC